MTYFAEDLLPNFRTADKCCAICRHCDVGYEGTGDCKALEKIGKKKKREVCTSIAIYEVCDLWEAQQ